MQQKTKKFQHLSNEKGIDFQKNRGLLICD